MSATGSSKSPPKARRKRRAGRPQRGFRLTERDLAIAAFIDRVGCATTEQVRERFGLSKRMGWRRLQALRESGRVRSCRPLIGSGILYPAGAAAPKLRDLDHSLTATAVALQLELEGADVVTERMMRRDEHAAGERSLWSVAMPQRFGLGRAPVTHRPDLAIRATGGLVAVEVELTRKSKGRLADLMAAWARQGQYGEVLYLCRSRELMQLVTSQACESGAQGVVRPTHLDTPWAIGRLLQPTA